MIENCAAGFRLPFPDLLEKVLAPNQVFVLVFERAPPIKHCAGFGELPFHHHLGRDPRVIEPRLPKHVIALHATPPDQEILKRVVEGVPHMQATGNVGWRYNDRIAGIFGPPARKRVGVLPAFIKPPFDFCGGIGFFERRHRLEPEKSLNRRN